MNFISFIELMLYTLLIYMSLSSIISRICICIERCNNVKGGYSNDESREA